MRNQLLSPEITAAVEAIGAELAPLSAKDQHKAIQAVVQGMRDARVRDGGGIADLDNRLREELNSPAFINEEED